MQKAVKEFADHYALLDHLIAAEAPPDLAPDDITLKMLAARAKCGPDKARRMLDKWVSEGKAEYIGRRREARGHAVEAWRLKGTE